MKPPSQVTLADVMSGAVQCIAPHQTLADAIRRLAESRISSLLIEHDGKPQGILTETDILRHVNARTALTTPVGELVLATPFTATAEMNLLAARQLTMQHNIRHLVIVSASGHTLGMVSDTDFRAHIGTDIFRHLQTLASVMEREIPRLPPESPLDRAICGMLEMSSDYVIVTENGHAQGILTERDIPRLVNEFPNFAEITLEQAMSRPLRGIGQEQPITEALRLMGEHRLRHMGVFDENGRLAGVICQRRLFDHQANQHFADALEQLHHERDRRRLETHMQMALDATGGGNWEYDHEHDRYLLSEGALKMFGCSADNAPANRQEMLARIHPEDLTERTNLDNFLAGTIADIQIRYRIQRDDQTWLWIENRGCIIERDKNGRPCTATGILTNINQQQLVSAALNRQNRALRMMSSVAQTLIRHDDEIAMLKEICAIALDVGAYQQAWVAQALHDSDKRIIALASAGIDREQLNSLNLSWDDVPTGLGPTGRAIRSGTPAIVRDSLTDPGYAPWRDWVRKLGFRASVALPLRVNGQIVGSLNLYSTSQMAFDDDEMPLLCDLAGEIGLGLAMLRSRAALAQREFRLQQAERLAHLGHFQFEPQLDTWTSSPTLDEIFGIDASFIRSKQSWLAIVHPEDRERLTTDQRAKIRAKQLNFDVEYRIVRRNDGQIRHVHGVGEVLLDANGRMSRLFGTIQDITTAHALQQRLLENQDALREAQSIANLGSWTLNIVDNTLACSEETCKIFGLGRDIVRSINAFIDRVHPDDRERVLGEWQAALHGQPYDSEHRIIVGENLRWVRERAHVHFNEQAEPVSAIGTVQDVSERRATEEELRKRSLAIEQSPHNIVITNIFGNIEYVNDAFVRNSGYKRAEIVGANPRLLRSGQTPQATYIDLWHTLVRGDIWRGEFINRRKDGSVYEEFAIISPIRQPDGKITHYLAIKEDVTEKKRIAAELENHRHHLEALVEERTAEVIKARDEAENANRAKSAFLANISHEIRTPMNAIMGLTHLSQRHTNDPEQQTRLVKIAGAAEHLLSIINDVLDLSKIEAGKLTLENTHFSLSEVFRTAHALIAERAEAKHLPLILDIDPKLPAQLHGDPLRLQQILLNFLSNAVKFTEQGEITIAARLLHENADGCFVRCEVRDTGIGIAPETQARLFNPFEQADSSTTRRFGGTGLGLAISRRLAELMNGAIGIDSQPGQGSTFWFTARLPRASTENDTNQSVVSHGSSEYEIAARHAGTRILLAEDNEINEEVATDLLLGAHLVVDIARNGVEAIAMASQYTYPLILMDMQMPLMDGLEATRQIRRLPGYASVPILAMTANAFEDDRNLCLAAGMNDHIAKPVDPKLLFAALAHWLPQGTSAPLTSPLPGRPREIPRPITPPGKDQALLAALGALPELDVDFGLQSVRGRLTSYCRLLGKFANNHVEDFARIHHELAQGNRDEARRLAHSLKGAAATLGASAVCTSAAALEAAIREAGNEADTETLIENCATSYRQLGQALAGLLPEEPLQEAVSPPIIQELGKLRQLLHNSDFSAQKLIAEQTPALKIRLGTRYPAFANAVDNFDFETALTLLDASTPDSEKQ